MWDLLNALLLVSKYVEYFHKCWSAVCSEVGNGLLLLLYGHYIAVKGNIVLRLVVVMLTAAIHTYTGCPRRNG